MANVPISKMQVPGNNDTLLLRDDSAANLVTGATSGNLAGLDANGNLTDSGVSASSIGNLSGSHLGTCETEASTSAKIVTIGDGTWIPKDGDIIGVKFTYSNTALFVTLNVNGIGNKGIWYGDSVDPSGADYICGKADSYIFYMYDGTYWIWLNEGQHDGNNFPSVAVYTQSNQQVKIGTCDYYTLTNKSYCHFIFRYPNTCKDMLFMKINNSSSKTIYINGEISSSTNYTLPAGTYIAYYENDKWYFRTDGILPAKTTEGAEINERLDTTTTSASGNPISITGLKSNQLAVNPVITFEPIQAGSGDPSPVNERPISGYDKIEVLSCGKNLCDNSKNKVGGYYNLIGQWVEGSGFASTGLIPVAPNTQYRGHIYDKNGNALNDIVWTKWSDETTCEGQVTDAYITTGANTRFVRLRNYSNESSYITNNNFLFALEKGNTSSTTYPAYHKTTDLSEPLPQTVYSGSLDLRTGKFTVDRVIVDLGDLSWSTMENRYYTSRLSNMKAAMVLCLAEKYVAASSYGSMTNGTFWIADYIYIKDSSTPSGKMVYELATPITIQLTPHEIPLLKDYAYVSTNGTSISLDYHNGEIATLGDVSQLGETVNELGNEVSEINTDVDGLKSKISLSGTAINLSAWSNDSTANIAVTTPTKIFVVQISASGGISGNVITR